MSAKKKSGIREKITDLNFFLLLVGQRTNDVLGESFTNDGDFDSTARLLSFNTLHATEGLTVELNNFAVPLVFGELVKKLGK